MTTDLKLQLSKLKQGDHICLIYENAAEQLAAVVPFIMHGLARGERCIYTVDDRTIEEVAQALAAAGVDVARERRRGALQLLNDLITVPSSGSAEVKVFRNVLVAGAPTFDASHPYRDFLAFPASFIGGAVVAAADMGSTPLPNGPFNTTLRDQRAEIIVGSSAGMTSTVKVFDVSHARTSTPSTPAKAAGSFTPFSTATTNYKGGVSLSVARINADFIPDIVVGAGVNGRSLVDVWAWNNTSTATLASLSANAVGFAAFTDASQTASVQVAAQDTNGDGIADAILAVQGPGGTTAQIRRYRITSVAPLQVSPFTSVPGSFLGPYFVATI